MKRLIKRFVFIFLFCLPLNICAQSLSYQGQITSWGIYASDSEDLSSAALRYIPEFRYPFYYSNKKSFDSELSLKFYTSTDNDITIEPYRIWIRYIVSQIEVRLGRQKINFGPAKILRSLKWFDTLDPQDPFDLSDGVKGLLVKYYFLNNTNLWLWGLLDNYKLKGLESIATDPEKIEFGSRYQFPLGNGEMAVSYNKRYLNQKLFPHGYEERFALDGIWDIGIGAWFEACYEKLEKAPNNDLHRKLFTVGSDYTISRLNIIYEQFLLLEGLDFDKLQTISNISALSFNYLISIFDNVNSIFYYKWLEDKFYAYLTWQRTYDNWQFNLSLFSNQEKSNSFNGKGAQILISYNY